MSATRKHDPTRAGVCQVCGCTEERGCPAATPAGVCYWADEERTLCSECVCGCGSCRSPAAWKVIEDLLLAPMRPEDAP